MVPDPSPVPTPPVSVASPPPVNQSPLKNRSVLILALVFVAVTILIVGGAYFGKSYFIKQESLPASLRKIETPVSAQFRLVHGILTSVSTSGIVVNTRSVTDTLPLSQTNGIAVNTGSVTETLSLFQTKDFQKLVSGTLAGGDVKTVPATIADLAVGQEVLIAIKLSSNEVVSVLIVK